MSRVGRKQALYMGALLLLCASTRAGGDGKIRPPSAPGASVDVLSLMRSGARTSGLGRWQTQGHVTVTAVTAAGAWQDAVIITCTAPTGCSPEGSDGNITVHEGDGYYGLHGLFMENISLAPGADYVLQALASARSRPQPFNRNGKIVDAFALVCPFVDVFTQATAGRGGDREILVGNCQAPLPTEEANTPESNGKVFGPARGGRLLSASAFSSTTKTRSRYTVGLFFGPTSSVGDSFLLFDLRILRPPQPRPMRHLIPATGPDGLLPHGDESPEAGRVGSGWAGWGQSKRALLRCPRFLLVKDGQWGVQVLRKYDRLVERIGTARPLHFYSYYGNTSTEQWDHIVWRHVGGLGYKRGQRVFEAGCAAGAFLDSIARQFGVEVAGVDFAGALIRVAQRRVPGSFCAADAANLSFVADEAFHHAVAFGVLTYVNEATHACSIAQQLLRITRPGGTVFLGQLNDPDLAIAHSRPPRMEGGLGVPPHYWYKFALEEGVDVTVARGEEVYSKRTTPWLRHYDLHAYLRYNVYLRKPAPEEMLARRMDWRAAGGGPDGSQRYDAREATQGAGGRGLAGADCRALRSSVFKQRYTRDAQPCVQPFTYKGVAFDDCTAVGARAQGGGREWCCLEDDCSAASSAWSYCAPALAPDPSRGRASAASAPGAPRE